MNVVELIYPPPADPRQQLRGMVAGLGADEEREPVSLRDHLYEVDPGPHRELWHVGRMVEACQAVLDGEITRLAVHAPPRTYKSRTVVQGLGSCWVRNNPSETVFLGMAVDTVMLEQAAWARDMVREAGVELRPDSTSKTHWRTVQKGGLIARTMKGGMLGVGGNACIVDDPFPSWEAAQRRLLQDQIWSLLTRGIWPRIETRKDGSPPPLVLMLQRLGWRDCAGLLYAALERGEHPFGPEEFTVLELKGIYRERRTAYPKPCNVIPDPRRPGDPLCSGSALADGIQAVINERAASDPEHHEDIDQQEPEEGAGGGHFKRSFFHAFGEGFVTPPPAEGDLRRDEIRRAEAMAAAGIVPPIVRWVRGTDLAAGGADALASVLWAVFAKGHPHSLMAAGITEEHPPSMAVEGIVLQRAESDTTQVEQAIPHEIAIGKNFALGLKEKMARAHIKCELVSEAGAKLPKTRLLISAAAPRCSGCGAVIVSESEAQKMAAGSFCACETPSGVRGGSICLMHASWNDRWREVFHHFTGDEGGDDHIVDAARIGHALTVKARPRGGGGYAIMT